MPTRLNTKTLGFLPASVFIPRYDRAALVPGIVHIGVGGFHRAHEAVYLDILAAQTGGAEWGICGIGLRPEDKAMRDALVPQDCLYTVITRDANGDQAHVIGSLICYLFAPEEEQAIRDVLASPQTRIVSLTITEGGYTPRPEQPGNVFRCLADALSRRRSEGTLPFTVLSCDNLPHNGDAAKRALIASVTDSSMTAWIEEQVTFPNAMVDRITPQTTDADRAMVHDKFSIEDAWPVVCEPFMQWIIEDKFCNGRPDLELVGAQFVPDVAPYETMKLSLLNGSHFAMAYLGFLAGFRTVPEAMADPQLRTFIRRMMDEEVTPLLPPVPGIDLAEYKATLLTRFDNPAIKDQITRLCADGSSKVTKFLLPSLHLAMATGRPHRLLTLALAGWMRYLTGIDESGRPFAIDDPRAGELVPLAREGHSYARPLLRVTDIFGDLNQSPRFVGRLSASLAMLQTSKPSGVRAAMTNALLKSSR